MKEDLKMSPAAFIYRLLFLEHAAATQIKNLPLASGNPNSMSAEEVYQCLLPIYRKIRSRYQTAATQASNWFDKLYEKLKHELHELSNIGAKLKEEILEVGHSDKVPFKVGYKDGVISCLLFLIRSYGLENENTGTDLTIVNKFLIKQNCYEGHYLNYLQAFKALGLKLDQKCNAPWGFRRHEITEKKINACLKSGNLILAYVWHSVRGEICQTPNPDHAYMENLNNQAHWVIILSLNSAGEYVVFNPDSGALSHLIWIKSLDEQKPFLAGSEEDYIPTKHLEEISTAFKVEEKIKALQIEVDSTQVSYLVVNRIYPFENYSVAEKTSQNVDQPDAFYVSTLKTTEQAIQFIAKHEEFNSHLYNCPPGNASIGYRHLVHLGAVNGTHPAETEEFKKGITKERATFFLHGDVKVKLKQHQFDALVCFVFSIKPSLFISSTLLKHINNSNFDQKDIEEAFLLFNKGTVIDEKSKLPLETTLPELTKRRKNEARLFNTGKYELEGEKTKQEPSKSKTGKFERLIENENGGYSSPLPNLNPSILTSEDYIETAEKLGLKGDVAKVKAIVAQEGGIGMPGFIDGHPRLLYEGHWFRKFTKLMTNSGTTYPYDLSHEQISYRYPKEDQKINMEQKNAVTHLHEKPNIKTKFKTRFKFKIPDIPKIDDVVTDKLAICINYEHHSDTIHKLKQALLLNSNAALQATSWGRCQVMGFNFKEAGFNSVEEMIVAIYKSEQEHLKVCINFVLSKKGCLKALQDGDWLEFAKNYNGSDHKANNYEKSIKKYYEYYTNIPDELP